MNPDESTGLKFNLADYFKAQDKTRELTRQIARLIKPGMTENQGRELLEKYMDDSGLEKRWHPTKFRMGINTICNFRDTSEEYILMENDIFFIDIGPVYFQHEGDYGESFVVGADARLEKLRDASKIIFNKSQQEWREKNLTGSLLYEFADREAQKMDLRLNSNMYGHRLGDFPHAVFSKRKLGSLDFTPAPNLWVLEIHLIDDEIRRGAFFEDILA